MSDIVIKVENLSKKYILSHQSQERYTTLRDVLSKGAATFARRIAHSFSNEVLKDDPSHEDFYALKDVSFEIKQGERVGIIGRNGAGKSTLLKVLSRITEPTSGRITLSGRVASLLEVGTGFHPELTGRENIFLNGAILGMAGTEIKRKFDEIVAFAEVERFLDTPVKRYSSGMYVRLAFAVAAHLEPEILIVDEVLAVGDAQFQKKCLGKMEEVGKEGRTVLFVSHNMAAIQTLCTTAINLQAGRVLDKGDVDSQVELYMKSMKEKADTGLKNIVDLGSEIELRRFEFQPNPIESCGELEYLIELWSPLPVNIDSLAVLIYSSFGMRIAILDLRQPDSMFYLDGNNPLIVRGKIKSFSLIDGDYNMGLFIACPKVCANFFNLVSLLVINKKIETDIVPYPANVRGVVELDFDVSIN